MFSNLIPDVKNPTRRLAISKRWEYRSAAVTVSCERKGTQYLIDSIAVFSVPRTGPPIPIWCRQETFLGPGLSLLFYRCRPSVHPTAKASNKI